MSKYSNRKRIISRDVLLKALVKYYLPTWTGDGIAELARDIITQTRIRTGKNPMIVGSTIKYQGEAMFSLEQWRKE